MNIDLSFYWRLFAHRLPVMLLFILLCSGLGVITALKLPETYRTSARLLVEEPQISERLVASTVQTDAGEQLDVIEQKLLTRARLIDIANQFRVFQDIGQMNPDTVFQEMRKATSIRRATGRNRATVMTISFVGRSGRVAANVVNELVTLVLQENTTFRRSRAEGALDFFRQEVQRLGDELDKQSAEITVFRSENASALPDEQRYRLDRINLLQERMAQLEREREAIENQRNEMVRIYESTGNVPNEVSAPSTPEEDQLARAEVQLQQARSLYSETHPQIVRLRSLVEWLEADVEAQLQTELEQEESGEEAKPSVESLLYQTALADIDTRTKAIASEIERIQAEIVELKQANAQSAANGIGLAALERDYVSIQNRYNSALNNLNTAQVGERIESTAQGQRITVIENASPPQTPSGPNRPLIAMMGASVGLGLAAGYFVLLEILNRTVRRPVELRQRYNIVPIAVIPYMESRLRRTTRRLMRVAAMLVVLVAVPLGLWYVDTNYIPLELVVQKGLAKFGLG